jgi:CheY-like chemotaxis protein
MGFCQHGVEGPRVLIVEDEGLIAAVVVETLDEEGYEARAVTDGRAALALLDTWRPCMILLDIMMPVMDGHAFLRKFWGREDPATIPVVLISAAGGPLLSDVDSRVADVIRKPFGMELLLDTVARLAR